MVTRRARVTEAATQAAIERYAEELAAQAPPLSDEMKAELRILLNPPLLRPAPAEAAPRHSSPGHAKAA